MSFIILNFLYFVDAFYFLSIHLSPLSVLQNLESFILIQEYLTN